MPAVNSGIWSEYWPLRAEMPTMYSVLFCVISSADENVVPAVECVDDAERCQRWHAHGTITCHQAWINVALVDPCRFRSVRAAGRE